MKKKNSKLLRMGLQISFLTYITFISVKRAFNLNIGGSLHGICPFGAVETFFTFITTGKFVKHTGTGNYFILAGLLLTLVVGGAFFCGWICPFGTVQESLGKLGKKIFKDKFNKVPYKIDKYLRFFKYLFLAFILFQTARQYRLVFENLDPYYTLFNIWSDEIALSGYIVLGITLLLSLYIDRPYCRYVCPLGAINGLFNKLSITTIKRDNANCVSCGMCDDVCPVNIKVSTLDKVNTTQCIRCMQCVEVCPMNKTKDTLKIETITKNKISTRWYFAIGTILFLFPIIFGVATNNMTKDEVKTYTSADDIRGSYTLKDIIKNYPITENELKKVFGLKNNLKLNTQLKSLGEQGVSVETIRLIIGGLDKKAKNTIKELKGKKLGDVILRELINQENTGYIMQFFKTEESQNIPIEIKRKTMLVDIKGIVKDYNDFLEHFGISKEEKENETLKNLIDKYNLNMTEIKDYVERNLR